MSTTINPETTSPQLLGKVSCINIYRCHRLVTSCQFYRLVGACQQVATSLSISSSCNKSVKIRLVATCHLQTCYASLLTTCNRFAVASHANASWYRLVVTSCCKMSTDLGQKCPFWLCTGYFRILYQTLFWSLHFITFFAAFFLPYDTLIPHWRCWRKYPACKLRTFEYALGGGGGPGAYFTEKWKLKRPNAYQQDKVFIFISFYKFLKITSFQLFNLWIRFPDAKKSNPHRNRFIFAHFTLFTFYRRHINLCSGNEITYDVILRQ